MSDYIKREHAVIALCELCNKYFEGSAPCDEDIGEECEFKKRFLDIPTVDAVEVVRCKDCRYATMTANGRFAKTCAMWTNEYYFDADYFCAEGERKEVSE